MSANSAVNLRLRRAGRAASATLLAVALVGAAVAPPFTNTAWAARAARRASPVIVLDGGASLLPAKGWSVFQRQSNGVVLTHSNPQGLFMVVATRGIITNVQTALKSDSANVGDVSLRGIETIKDNFSSFDRMATAGFSLHAGKGKINTNFGEIVELLDTDDGYRAFVALIAFSLAGLKSLTPSVVSMIGYLGDNSAS